jgi:phage shock protein A
VAFAELRAVGRKTSALHPSRPLKLIVLMKGSGMIIGKMWAVLRAQINKVANFFWTADPIAQMQYEYDSSVSQLQDGRKGLEQYRALVERVSLQVANAEKHAKDLEAKVKAYLQAGDRETAAKFALEMQKAKGELEENQAQLKMHEEAYNNNLEKIKHASGKSRSSHSRSILMSAPTSARSSKSFKTRLA